MAKFEQEALINNQLSATRGLVANTLISFQSQKREFNASGGSISHILNINNINQDYKIPELSLNEVYPYSILPITVTPGEIYDDEADVYLEQLHNITERVRKLTPTSTLYAKYQSKGFDINQTLIESGRDFDELGLSQREVYLSDPDRRMVFDFDEVEDRIRKVTENVSIINSIINLTNSRISYSRTFIRNLFQITPEYLNENRHGLNGIYDPSEIPTNVGNGEIYDDDIDLYLERLENIFDVAEFNFDTYPSLARKYRDTAGLDITDSLRRAGVDAQQVQLIANSFESATPELYDIETISQQVIVLEDTIQETFLNSIELLYKQTAILNQLPKTIEQIFANLAEEITDKVEEAGGTEEEVQVAVTEGVKEVLEDLEESREEQERENEVLQEDDELDADDQDAIIVAETPGIPEIEDLVYHLFNFTEIEEIEEIEEVVEVEEEDSDGVVTVDQFLHSARVHSSPSVIRAIAQATAFSSNDRIKGFEVSTNTEVYESGEADFQVSLYFTLRPGGEGSFTLLSGEIITWAAADVTTSLEILYYSASLIDGVATVTYH